jgi:hypothetical protein
MPSNDAGITSADGGGSDGATGVPVDPRGWDEPPGTGRVFVIDALEIGTGQVGNALGLLGPLMSSFLENGVLGAQNLLLIEVAGLEDPYQGQDQDVVIKVYSAVDADQPNYPANNFHSVPGDPTPCCQFKISAQSLTGNPPQARSRALARIRNGALEAAAGVVFPPLVLPSTTAIEYFSVDQAIVSASLPSSLGTLEGGLVGGAITIHALAAGATSLCAHPETSMGCPAVIPHGSLLDIVVAGAVQPDVDLDGDGQLDGLGRDVTGSGRVNTCEHDGNPVAPITAGDPSSCALQAVMADGFSILLDFHAVAATIVGVAP